MKTTFFPAVNDQWGSMSPVKFGIAVHVPDNYDPAKKYPCKMFVHGMGNLGAGSKGELENLWLGYSYTPGAARVNPAVPQDYMDAIDQKGMVCVFVNYKDFFLPAHFAYTHDLVLKNFSVVKDWKGDGFSWGAGALMKAIRDVQSAPFLRVVCPVAATYEGSSPDESFAFADGVCAWLFVNDGDDNKPYTSIDVTQRLVADMNKTGPITPAVYTAFHATGHGGTNAAFTKTPPVAPGGQGFINAIENTDDYYLDILKNGPRQPKGGSIPSLPPPPLTNMVANGTVTQVGDILKLDASASTGWVGIGWRVDKAPDGINPYTFVKSGGWKTSDTAKALPGDYQISLILTAADKSTVMKVFKVTVAGVLPVPKTAVAYDSITGTLLFSDRSQEKATAVVDFINKIVIVTTTTGVTYKY